MGVFRNAIVLGQSFRTRTTSLHEVKLYFYIAGEDTVILSSIGLLIIHCKLNHILLLGLRLLAVFRLASKTSAT